MEPTSAAVTTPSEDIFNDEDSIIFDIGSEEFTDDHFRMYEFKVKRCPKQKPHDWTQCPFAHCGERATRRDPLFYKYSGSACAEFRRNGMCSRGDACPYAHGVFECWLHPGKYKTQMCSDTKKCKRPVCFFAHHPSELRTPDATNVPGPAKAEGAALKPPPIRMELPSLKQPKARSMSEMAVRIEELQRQIQQSATPPGSPMHQNPVTTFINSVLQLQHSMPSVNIVQLLQAIIGTQQQCSSPPTPTHNPEAVAALMQAQSAYHAPKQQDHLHQHGSDLLRQMHELKRSSHGAPLDHSCFRAMSCENTPLGEHSGPFSGASHRSSGASMGNSGSISGMSGCAETTYAVMPPHVHYGMQHPCDGTAAWTAFGDLEHSYEVRAPSSRGSDRSARSEMKSSAGGDLWQMRDSIWSAACKEDAGGDGGARPSSQLLRHVCSQFGSKDSLLDVLPRDLSDLRLTDVTNSVAQ